MSLWWDLVCLDVFAVQFRYTTYEDPGAPLDRDAVRIAVGSLLDHVSNLDATA